MALRLKLKPHSHHHCTIPSLRHLSSSSSSPPPPPPPSDQSPSESEHQPEPHSQSQPHPSVSSYFSDIKQRLGSPPSPPRRIPLHPSPPPPFLSSSQSQNPPASLEEIRKHLAAFRGGGSGSTASVPSSAPSFQSLLKNNAQTNATGSSPAPSFDAIRQSLRQSRSSDSFFSLKTLQEKLRSQEPQQGTSSIIGSDGKQLPEAIFGREAKERRMAEEGGKECKRVMSQFIKAYTHQELGEKLVRLRPEGEKKKKGGFSLNELNQRLIKLREMEEKEKDATSANNPFKTLRESLHNIQNAEERKMVQPRMSIFPNLGGLVTPTYMLKPPQEQLLEKYFHPDHMSSAEKMKLELKKVRDEFKMSESDCGSTRVQVAQLTTKIKFLSTVLHKKDKHSIKGLQEMVQRRKKLLKYLRRTDWDSYCLVLSKLGLRDVPEYKAPDYKTKPQTKTKSKSKSKKSKSRMRA